MPEQLLAVPRDRRESVLHTIVARTRADVAERMRRVPLQSVRQRPAPPIRDFLAALSAPGLSLIAEFKPASPSRGAIRPASDAPEFAKIYGQHANAISVLCDTPFFGGGYPLLQQFRGACQQPLLCKDFIVSEYQLVEARSSGADAVLLMASIHSAAALRDFLAMVRDLGMHALVEVHTEAELDDALACDAPIIGVNSRDLKTLDIDIARLAHLRKMIPADRVAVAESGIRSRAQADELRGIFDAVLIGTAFMTADDPAACMAELGW